MFGGKMARVMVGWEMGALQFSSSRLRETEIKRSKNKNWPIKNPKAGRCWCASSHQNFSHFKTNLCFCWNRKEAFQLDYFM